MYSNHINISYLGIYLFQEYLNQKPRDKQAFTFYMIYIVHYAKCLHVQCIACSIISFRYSVCGSFL